MKLVIGADHGGFLLKEEIKNYLTKQHIKFIDIGNHTFDSSDDYPDFAIPLADKISKGEADRGIIICGSGVGACIAANKLKGVRACVCHDSYSAHQGVEHDDMNVLCLGGRIIGVESAKEIVSAFLSAKFSGEERHQRRLNKILKLEKS